MRGAGVGYDNFKLYKQTKLKVMKFIWEKWYSNIKRNYWNMERKYGWKQTTTLTLYQDLLKTFLIECRKIDRYSLYNTIVWSDMGVFKCWDKRFLSNIHDNSLQSLISALHDDEVVDKDMLDLFESHFKNLEEE